VTPLYPQKLALTSLTGGGRSVGMVRSRTKTTEFSLVSLENVTEGTILKTKCRYEDKIRIGVKEVLNEGNWNQLARNGSSNGLF
jgi:hypothetical protein